MIGQSVGNARFGDDAHKLMTLLLPFRDQLKQENMNAVQQYSSSNNTSTNKQDMAAFDNSAYNYINQLFARISKCIGDSFVQYFSSYTTNIRIQISKQHKY